MKFRVDKQEFLKNLNTISSIVPAKPVVTIISNIMIEAKKDILSFSSTDFEITMHSEMPASVAEDGVIVINAKTIVELVRKLPEGELSISLSNDEVSIKSKSGVYKIPVIKKDDYVEISRIEKNKMFNVDSLPVKSAVDNSVFAVSKDAVKVAITGVLLEGAGKNLTFVGTDGHRLALYSIKDIFEKPISNSVIVPPKVLTILRDLIDDVDEFSMGFDEKRIMFKVKTIEVWAKLIEGTFPDYKRVIPSDNNKILIVKKEELVNSLNIINVFTNPNTRLVKFEIEHAKLTINAYQNQTGEGTEFMEVDYEDKEKLVIGFNNNYLLEILKRIETENVKFKFKGEMFAVIIENEVSKVDQEAVYIIMPLRLK